MDFWHFLLENVYNHIGKIRNIEPFFQVGCSYTKTRCSGKRCDDYYPNWSLDQSYSRGASDLPSSGEETDKNDSSIVTFISSQRRGPPTKLQPATNMSNQTSPSQYFLRSFYYRFIFKKVEGYISQLLPDNLSTSITWKSVVCHRLMFLFPKILWGLSTSLSMSNK